MLEALCELESLCCRIATQRMSAMQRRQLELLHEEAEAAADKRDADAYLALNSRFHQLICQGTQNATLVAAVKACASGLRRSGRRNRGRAPFRGVASRAPENRRSRARGSAGAGLPMRSHTTRLTLNVMELIQAQHAGKAA